MTMVESWAGVHAQKARVVGHLQPRPLRAIDLFHRYPQVTSQLTGGKSIVP